MGHRQWLKRPDKQKAKMFFHFTKAPYLFRPWQIVRRIWRGIFPVGADEVETVLPWGLPIHINPRETIGRAIWHSGVHDLDVCEALWRLTEPGDIAVDVGANIGQMTSLLALRAGPKGKVFAFEPHPLLFKRLERSAAKWSSRQAMAQLTIAEVAIGAREGYGFLMTGADFHANEGTAKLVSESTSPDACRTKVTTLDNYLANISSVGVLKIDVEGAEWDVFRGAHSMIQKGRIRDILYECSAESSASIAEWLQGYGYAIFILYPGWLRLRLTMFGKEASRKSPVVPTWLATIAPERALQRFKKAGWLVLGHNRRCE